MRLAHFGSLCAWAGVLLVELVVEAVGSRREAQSLATRVHFWVDVLVELPIVAAVLATGVVLLVRVWPPTTLHIVKTGSALVAIGVNLYCSVMVILRYRARGDEGAVGRYGRRVRLSGLGIPFGAVAAYVGLTHFL